MAYILSLSADKVANGGVDAGGSKGERSLCQSF